MKTLYFGLSMLVLIGLGNSSVITYAGFDAVDSSRTHYEGVITMTELNNGTCSDRLGGMDCLDAGYTDSKLYDDALFAGGVENPSKIMVDINVDGQKDRLSLTDASIGNDVVLEGWFMNDIESDDLNEITGVYDIMQIAQVNATDSKAVHELLNAPGGRFSFDLQGRAANGHLAAVPEPTTMGLLGLGLLFFGFYRRKRNQ